ncbi:MAG: hypothetical protein IID44_28640 [Planctomycetes bacterium]|nr:hypothetical protein [Planctomycetota bacterium]
MRLLIHKEGDGTHGHLHFDVARDDHFEEISVLNTVELETLLEYTEHFIGQEVQLSPSARFRIPIADIPKLGIVSTLLGVTTQACGAEMSLVGAALSISDETFDYVRWSRDGDNVTAYLEADTETIVDDQYLTNIESLMIGGFDCFVLEITAASGGDEDSKNEDNGESESTRDVAAS